MERNGTRRSSLWKPLLLLPALLFVVIVGVSVWFISLRDRRWEALERRVRDLQSEIEQAPPLPRLALGRPVLPGNAWDDYLKAWPAAAQHPPSPGEVSFRDFLERKPGVDQAKVESRLSGESARMDLLRSGARREFARLPPTKQTANGLERDVPSHGHPINLVELAVAQARVLSERGQRAEALDLLTDVCLAARDLANVRLMESPEWGFSAMDWAFCELRDLIQSPQVLGKELKDIDRTLALLDDAFPDTSGLLKDELFKLGELLIREDREDEVLMTFSDANRARHHWRTGFSSRLQAAAVFSAGLDLVLRELEIEKLPWSTAWQANQELFREMERHRDPLIRHGFVLLSVQDVIQTRGSLRLLRVAVHYRATGEMLALEDPVGGVIRARQEGGSMLFWKKHLFDREGMEPAPMNKTYRYWNTVELPRR